MIDSLNLFRNENESVSVNQYKLKHIPLSIHRNSFTINNTNGMVIFDEIANTAPKKQAKRNSIFEEKGRAERERESGTQSKIHHTGKFSMQYDRILHSKLNLVQQFDKYSR